MEITQYNNSFHHASDLRFHLTRATKLAQAAAETEGLDLLKILDELVSSAHQARTYAGAQCRYLGATWAEIGDVLDVTRQAAQQRFPDHPRKGSIAGVLSIEEEPLL